MKKFALVFALFALVGCTVSDDELLEENLEKIATQRSLVNYTNGYESWSIVRDTWYPTAAVITSDNNDI